jgi:hypothetical protein
MLAKRICLSLLCLVLAETPVFAKYETVQGQFSGLGCAEKKGYVHGVPKALSISFRVVYRGDGFIKVEFREPNGELLKVLVNGYGPVDKNITCNVTRSGTYKMRVLADDDKGWVIYGSQMVKTR